MGKGKGKEQAFYEAEDMESMGWTMGTEEGGELPPLTPEEFKAYNRLAEQMDYFHDHFRASWTRLYEAAASHHLPPNTTESLFIEEGLTFITYLRQHHDIEENHLFPILAQRMPEFAASPPTSPTTSSSSSKSKASKSKSKSKDKDKSSKSSSKASKYCLKTAYAAKKAAKTAEETSTVLLNQHKEIHAGMETFRTYLQRCKDGKEGLDMGVLRGKMDTWGLTLWEHLDEEVIALGAENMRVYWGVDEVAGIPI